MSIDLATLGIKVDATEADKAGVSLDRLANAGGKAEKATQALTGAMNSAKSATAEAERSIAGASNSASAMAERAARLKASVDPLGTALDRVNGEMAEAETLYSRGAISAAQFAEAQGVLTARAEKLQAAQAHANRMLAGGANAARLTSNEMLNLSRQASDVGVSLAMGMNPLMVLIQQGPQVADVLAMAGQRGIGAGAAFRQMGVALWGALAPALPIIAGVAAGVALVGGAFAMFSHEVEKNVGDVNKGLNLTDKQLKHLKESGVDTSVTLGDTFHGLFTTIGDRLTTAFAPQIEWIEKKFAEFYGYVRDGAAWSVKALVGGFYGAYAAITATWQSLPAAFSDIAIQAANGVISIVESMVNKVIAKINAITSFVNGAAGKVGLEGPFGDIANVNVGRIANPNAGAASRTMERGIAAGRAGFARGGAAVDSFFADVARNTDKARDKRVLAAAGDAGGSSGGSGRGSRERATDRANDDAADYIRQLRQETAEIGKNRIEVRMMAAEREAAKAPTKALADEIRATAAAWKDATIAHANDEFKRSMADEVEQLAFENSLIGKNAAAREAALATRQIELRIREQERQGLTVNREAIAAETAAIIANARARGEREDMTANAKAATEAVREMTDALREGVDGFGELFGTAGGGFANLVNVMADYADRRAELQERIAEADERTAEGQRERQRATDEMARAEIAHYGEILGAAKSMFDEKSAGYKVLEAAERAYRAYQLVSLIVEAAGAAKSIALDNVKTASSVANSGTRAAADGVAAIAKAIASLPFPLNIAAGAATAAALVAFGVKVLGGGGKGGSATASADKAVETYSGPRDEYGAPTSSYSVLKPGRTTVAGNDNGYGPSVGMAPANRGGDTFTATYTIDARGAEQGVEARIRAVLEQNEDRVVQRARQASAADRASAVNRQRIGGS